SGKSNISDAIRWVLGEQSTKTLRGAKMEDVIFGGTGKRSPMGFAEVSLTIDNERRILNIDYNEVTVTRRYYRSGESEFYINRSPVRLKDIHELFMDTGLGRDGYSIIGQGRIDEILSVKSDDRREIFEEASGITKFRYRKDESERKLLSTDENLVRVNDIVETLRQQVEPLREQAKTAKKYLTFRDELRVLEVSSWLDYLDKMKTGLIKTRTDYENVSSQLEKSREELDRLYRLSEELAQQMHAKDTETERVRSDLNETERLTAAFDSELAVLRTNLRNNSDNISRIENEIADQSGREGGLKAQIDAKTLRIEEIEDLERDTKGKLDILLRKAQETASVSNDIDAKIDALSAEQQSMLDRASEYEKSISSLESVALEIESRKKALEAELEKKNEALLAEENKAGELNLSLKDSREKLESLLNAAKGYELKLSSREKKAAELRETERQTGNLLDSQKSRLQMLSDMEKEYEGFPKSVKMVMQQKEHGALRNIHGPVSRLITAPEQYSVAIEIALGGSMQSIVVDREEDAKAAIGYLKSSEYGRATFLPLSAVRGQELKENGLFQEEGFLGLGHELISFDPKYREIVKNLLGRTVIVNHIDTAIKMARKYQNRFKIVTLDGQVMNPGGSMTGGSVGKNSGMLSRAGEILRLKDDILKGEEKRVQTERLLKEAEREYNAVRYDLELLKADQRESEDSVLRLESVLSQHEALLKSIKDSITAQQDELQSLDKRVKISEDEIEKAKKDVETERQNALKTENEIKELSLGKSGLLDKQGSLTEQMNGLRGELGKLAAERETLEKSAAELSELYKNLTDDRKRRADVISGLVLQNAEISRQISEKEALKDESLANAEKKKEILKLINTEKMNIEGERVKKEKESQSKNREMLNLEQERSRLESQKTQAEMEERQIIERLWESYELTQLTAQSVRKELESPSKTNRRINDLKSEIKLLGQVNIGAIEEFKRVNEQYGFLTAQKDDLEKAKKELLKVIADITSSMKDLFTAQFAKINESFDATFREIFGGGTAELKLDDPDDVLNCGIEIRVSLPGKTLKTITLLSGGEKAFVAIALYFSILKVRPAPFCVLDEIEAALDDVNVARFASYIKKLCGTTQFIAITHRRGTMEVSDMLYGVTMQERGVSKLLALNVSEVEQKLNIKIK
ncbi:MAG: chromosome segregation protein SMC, partial [Bacillota bacterium]|nr:chromosome segregation protein SMC [Bacillota bacterium]